MRIKRCQPHLNFVIYRFSRLKPLGNLPLLSHFSLYINTYCFTALSIVRTRPFGLFIPTCHLKQLLDHLVSTIGQLHCPTTQGTIGERITNNVTHDSSEQNGLGKFFKWTIRKTPIKLLDWFFFTLIQQKFEKPQSYIKLRSIHSLRQSKNKKSIMKIGKYLRKWITQV